MNDLLTRFSQLIGLQGMSDVVLWAVLITILMVFIFVGRFALRSMVNKRVRGINEVGMTFMDIEKMKRTGLISDEELKEVRKRLAQRELAEHTADTKQGLSAAQILATIEADPSTARQLLPPSSERARAAVAGLGHAHPEADSELIMPRVPEPLSPPPARKSRASAEQPSEPDAEPEYNTDPLYQPAKAEAKPELHPQRPAPQPTAKQPLQHAGAPRVPAPAAPPRKASSGKQLDIDTLLSKGLISRDEYDRLASLVDEAGKD